MKAISQQQSRSRPLPQLKKQPKGHLWEL